MAEQRQKEKDDLLREHKKTERELIRKGKKPFYMKKCKPPHNYSALIV